MGPIISTPFSWLTCSCQSIYNSAFTDYKHSVSKSPEKSFLRTRNLTEPTRSRTEAEENLKKTHPENRKTRPTHRKETPHHPCVRLLQRSPQKESPQKDRRNTHRPEKHMFYLPNNQKAHKPASFFSCNANFGSGFFAGSFQGKTGRGEDSGKIRQKMSATPVRSGHFSVCG